MSKLKHFLFLDRKNELDYEKVEDNFFIYDDCLYKIDVVNNEIFFLKASLIDDDLVYDKVEFVANDIKYKTLKYKRAFDDSNVFERFTNFCIKTCADENLYNLEVLEYERLKTTLLYGLKSKKFGISIGFALRCYLYFLSANNKKDEIIEILRIFSYIFHKENLNILFNNSDDFFMNLSCLVFDKEGFYTNSNANDSFSLVCAKYIRLYAINTQKDISNVYYLLLLLDFAGFFKQHKKLNLQSKLLKNKNIKKSAKKISKIARTYYLG